MASGPSLTFISLPRVFASMGGVGRIVGIVFFLALGFAALTSCVSVMETLVANCMEIFHKSRKEMCAMVGVYSLVTAILICLGYNVFYFELTLPNGSAAQLLDVMDYISNSFLMPFISLLTSILIGWVIGPKWVIDEVEKNGEHFELTEADKKVMEEKAAKDISNRPSFLLALAPMLILMIVLNVVKLAVPLSLLVGILAAVILFFKSFDLLLDRRPLRAENLIS